MYEIEESCSTEFPISTKTENIGNQYIQYSFISLNFYNNSIQLKFQYSVVCARHHDEQNALKKKNKNFSFFAPYLIKWNLLNTFSILINHIPCLCLRQQGLVES